MNGDIEMDEHVCQSCGLPVDPEDYVEGSEQGDFCHFCMVHGEFVADRAEVKEKIAERLQESGDITRDEALAQAEETMSSLKRWQ